MKFLLAAFLAVFTLMSSTATVSAADGPYRHVVLFKFKDSATKEQIKEVEGAFRKLQTQIDSIVSFEFGTNVSPEHKNDGYTHCFFVTFADKAGVDKYLPHPAHKAFGVVLRPILDKVLVIDYVAQK